MKKLLAATAIFIAIASTNPAYAVDLNEFKNPSWEEFKKMSPEDKQSFMEQRKAKWEKLSKEDKVQVIEHRRKEKISKMEERWSKMSDDEKIKFVEKRMEKRRKWMKEGGKRGRNGEGKEHHAE